MFHFPGLASQLKSWMIITDRVSPFGHLRIKGYKSPPRSISQTSHVLHRLRKPRHPPCTLLVSCAETRTPLTLFFVIVFSFWKTRRRAIQYIRTFAQKRDRTMQLITYFAYSCVNEPVLSPQKTKAPFGAVAFSRAEPIGSFIRSVWLVISWSSTRRRSIYAGYFPVKPPRYRYGKPRMRGAFRAASRAAVEKRLSPLSRREHARCSALRLSGHRGQTRDRTQARAPPRLP
jgi:hypothetical protein